MKETEKEKRYLIPKQIRQRMVYSGVSHKGSNVPPPPGDGLHFTTPSCSCSSLNPQPRINASQKHVKSCQIMTISHEPVKCQIVLIISCLHPSPSLFSPQLQTSPNHSKSLPRRSTVGKSEDLQGLKGSS